MKGMMCSCGDTMCAYVCIYIYIDVCRFDLLFI